jgi:hypothetical protein
MTVQNEAFVEDNRFKLSSFLDIAGKFGRFLRGGSGKSEASGCGSRILLIGMLGARLVDQVVSVLFPGSRFLGFLSSNHDVTF